METTAPVVAAQSLVQSIDYAAIAPPLVLVLTAFTVLMADLVVPGRRWVLVGLSVLGLLVGLGLLAGLRDESRSTFCLPGEPGQPAPCSYVVSDFTLVLQLVVLAGTAVVVLLSMSVVRESRIPAGEYFFLLLCSAAGAATLAAARDLILLVIALEVVSLPAFALVGLRRYDGRSSEAALKFFLVSVVSTAVMLFGISLTYGVTGSVHLTEIAGALADPDLRHPVAAVGVVLALVGFAFKVSAVPFHFWTPDTYVGAPVPVAAYLSVVSKAAGFAGLVLVVGIGFRPYTEAWGPVVAALAALTMTVGNLVALRQRHAVRLLAWSSIAHAGYMLVPLAVVSATGDGTGDGDAAGAEALAATVTYLLVYAVMNLGAFAAVGVVARERPRGLIDDYRGLFQTRPATALSLAFVLVCLAGLPPGLVGLFAKIVVFRAAVDGGLGWLAVVMAINTVIALYYYLVWVAALFAQPAPEEVKGHARVPVASGLAVGVTAGAALLLSVVPQLVLQVLSGLRGGFG